MSKYNNILLYSLIGSFVLIIDKYLELRQLCYYGILLNIEWNNNVNRYYSILNCLRLHFLEYDDGDEESAGIEMDDLIHLCSGKYSIGISSYLYDSSYKINQLVTFFPYIPKLKKLYLNNNDSMEHEYVNVLLDNLIYLTSLTKLDLSGIII